jgi:hypothetical protein
MRVHPAARDSDIVEPPPIRYAIRIHGHLGAMVLSAFPALVPQRHGADAVLSGLLDRSVLYGVLAEIEGARPGPGRGPAAHTAPEITKIRRQPLNTRAPLDAAH